MTLLTKIRNWLLTFPLWNAEWTLYTDYTDGMPGNGGLYPSGAQELGRVEDVAGNVTVRCRYRFCLYRVADQQDMQENANWLLAFQQWVQQQSATGAAPRLGDDPKRERIWAEKGKLLQVNQAGTGKYAVSLIADFVKQFKEE